MPESVLILADFNSANLKTLLARKRRDFEVFEAPFGQTTEIILQPDHATWKRHYQTILVWSAPEKALVSYSKAQRGESYDVEHLEREVMDYCELLERLKSNCGAIVHPCWVHTRFMRGGGSLSMLSGFGVGSALLQANCFLLREFADRSLGHVLDTSSWLINSRQPPYSEKLWYLAKIPFSDSVFQSAADDILATVQLLRGAARKLIVLDLDNTLWGGVLGEDGPDRIRLGGLDPLGEAFQDFQHYLKGLVRRGFILAIISKNDEQLALDVIREHPEMVLRESDFAGWRINWRDKAENLSSLVDELNLGINSAIFIDDSPFERERIKSVYPDVLVPELKEPLLYRSQLEALCELDRLQVTKEDQDRQAMYVSERRRRFSRSDKQDLSDWVASLDLKIEIAPVDSQSVRRAVQLMNKTNQMNLACRRMTESEFDEWRRKENHHSWSVRVRDKFGDYGLSGLVCLCRLERKVILTDFCLSCRVLGRKVEHTLLAFLGKYSFESLEAETFEAEFIPLKRNQACLLFLQETYLHQKENSLIFMANRGDSIEAPRGVTLQAVQTRETPTC